MEGQWQVPYTGATRYYIDGRSKAVVAIVTVSPHDGLWYGRIIKDRPYKWHGPFPDASGAQAGITILTAIL